MQIVLWCVDAQTSAQKPLVYTTEHVRVGFTLVGLTWTRFSSLL